MYGGGYSQNLHHPGGDIIKLMGQTHGFSPNFKDVFATKDVEIIRLWMVSEV